MDHIKGQPLKIEDFERSLQSGLGRAIQYLKQHDATLYQDVILNACLHNTTYDPQVEGSRVNYLFEIINLTGNITFYRNRVLQATRDFNETTGDWDVFQLVELTALLAKHGDREARKVLYDVFIANVKDEDALAALEIIEVDGVSGFMFVIDHIVPIIKRDPDPVINHVILYALEESIGKAELPGTLNALRKLSPNVDWYLTLLEGADKESEMRPKRQTDATLSYAEVKHRIEHGIHIDGNLWGREADEDSLRQAAADLLLQTDPKRVYAYLRIFIRRPFPLEPHKLFSFMDLTHPVIRLPVVTLGVLAQIQHPSVREFALKLISEDQHPGCAVELLARNFVSGDWSLIEQLSMRPYDDQTRHDLGWSVQAIFKWHPTPLAVQTLLNVYEYGPCSTCRRHILLMLQSINAVPEAIREECNYDANYEIRELAKKDFDTSKD